MKTFKDILTDSIADPGHVKVKKGDKVKITMKDDDDFGKKGKVISVSKKGIKVEFGDGRVGSFQTDEIMKESADLQEASGQNMIWDLLDQRKLSKLMPNMDEQSTKLLHESIKILGKSLTLPGRQGQAFNRLRNLIESGQTNEGMLRNQIFKIANELKIKLPSSSF